MAYPNDDLDGMRRQFEMTRERRDHMRATLRQRIGETLRRLEHECKEMGEELDRLNALYPDVSAPAEAPGDYPIGVDMGRMR